MRTYLKLYWDIFIYWDLFIAIQKLMSLLREHKPKVGILIPIDREMKKLRNQSEGREERERDHMATMMVTVTMTVITTKMVIKDSNGQLVSREGTMTATTMMVMVTTMTTNKLCARMKKKEGDTCGEGVEDKDVGRRQ